VKIQPAASTTTAAAGGTAGYADGTYAGGDENAYYGRVQVQVTVANHQVASVKVLDYPQDRRTSRYINSQACDAAAGSDRRAERQHRYGVRRDADQRGLYQVARSALAQAPGLMRNTRLIMGMPITIDIVAM